MVNQYELIGHLLWQKFCASVFLRDWDAAKRDGQDADGTENIGQCHTLQTVQHHWRGSDSDCAPKTWTNHTGKKANIAIRRCDIKLGDIKWYNLHCHSDAGKCFRIWARKLKNCVQPASVSFRYICARKRSMSRHLSECFVTTATARCVQRADTCSSALWIQLPSGAFDEPTPVRVLCDYSYRQVCYLSLHLYGYTF